MNENLAKRLKRPQKVNVYSQVASFYDQLMDHVDYPEWAEYIDILLQQYGSDVQHVVDGGCGTGRMIEAMRKFNYKMVGFYRSIPRAL